MGISIEEYHQVLQDASGSRIFSLDELQEVGEVVPATEGLPRNRHTEGPYDGLRRDAFRDALAEAIASLPERERLVIALYYDEELNLREIGQVLGSASRASARSTARRPCACARACGTGCRRLATTESASPFGNPRPGRYTRAEAES